jgi:hypothetical protein
MHHHYGRHGPHAWKRLQERRYRHHSVYPVPVPRVATVYVRLPVIDAERIIIIMTMPEGFDPEKMSRELQVQPSFEGTGLPRIVVDQQIDFPEELRALASLAAMQKAQQDINADPEDLPSRSALQQVARTAAIDHIRQYITGHSEAAKYYERFIPIFADIYLEAYENEVKEQRRAGIVPDDQTLHIHRVVRTDKDALDAQGKYLSPEYLRYLATARAMRDLGLDIALSFEDLDKIHGYVGEYCTYFYRYTPKSKEVGQFRGSSSFS